MTFTQKYLLIGLTKKLFSLTKFFFVKPSATMTTILAFHTLCDGTQK